MRSYRGGDKYEALLNPIEEDVIGETSFEFPGGDKDIIARVIQGDAEDMDDVDESDDEDELPALTKPSEALAICGQMERLCLEYASSTTVLILDLQTQLRKLHGHIRRIDDQSRVQSSLDQFWLKNSRNEDS